MTRLSIGPDLALGQRWIETGSRDVLKSLPADRRVAFDVECATHHRLTILGSGRHATDWRSPVRVLGVGGLDLDQAMGSSVR